MISRKLILEVGRDRDAWKLILKEAKVLHRQHSQRTEREREKGVISQVIPLWFSLNKVHKSTNNENVLKAVKLHLQNN
jgi:hypothetical protein